MKGHFPCQTAHSPYLYGTLVQVGRLEVAVVVQEEIHEQLWLPAQPAQARQCGRGGRQLGGAHLIHL